MVKLRDHQKRVLGQLRSGAVLQGGVGSGKSITSLAYYYKYELLGEFDPLTLPKNMTSLYIITTARKRDLLEWDKELTGFALSRDPEASIQGIKVVIDSWNNIRKYVDVKDSFFIFDEQRLVGSGAWVKAFLNITKNNNRWMLLTATPGDTWIDYAPVFIANGYYKNKTEFVVKHIVYSRFSKYPKIDHYINVEDLVRHRDSVLIPMDYKHDVKIFPVTRISDYDKKAMEIVSQKRWNIFTDKPIKNAGELCHVQRRIVNTHVSRLAILEEVQQFHPKLIVFYNFNYELELLRDFLRKSKIKFSEWNGQKHEPIPGTDNWVYLVQYTAGAEGWNCIETNAILFFSQNYSYKIKTQAEGRINRLNTPFNELFYYYVRSESRIDDSIFDALKKKRNFNEKDYEARFAS